MKRLMEFLEYLDKTEIEIIKIVEKAGYEIEENTPLCLLSDDYVGFLDKRREVIVICTRNAKKRENHTLINKANYDTFERTALHIKKALRHEAVHVAQECNDGKIIKIEEKFSMNLSKMKALNRSLKISEEEEKERQAYILEDKPILVEKKLKKYCL
tara:strand:- start:1717 stop:2187 length:471 start_codon:yes stop_codon:yes gene_type:complete